MLPERRKRITRGPAAATVGVGGGDEPRLPYEAPRILKRHEVRRVTLFSGGGVVAVGLTASG